MMKYLMMMLFFSVLMISNSFIFFYYNFMFILSFLFLFSMCEMGEYFVLIGSFMMVDKYSYILILLSVWVVGLMFMVLESEDVFLKKMMFMLMLIILYMFFSMGNMMLFYLFFEMSLVPIFMLVIYWGYNPERLSASFYMLLYTMLVSLPFLVYLMYMFKMFYSFDFYLLKILNKFEFSVWGFFFLVGSFLVKMPMFMYHIWLPKAHVEAPVYGSMILAAVLLKLGSYGLVRFLLIFLKEGSKFKVYFLSIGLIGSLIISLISLVQIDMKSLVAYSSVVHMNLMMCSLFSMMNVGFFSALIMMVSHGLCSSGLFYMVNLYYYRSKSRLLILNKGMGSILQMFSFWWFLMCVSNFSFPMSLGFLGEIFCLGVLVSLDGMIIMNLILISFFSSVFSLYLYLYIQHGDLYFQMKKFVGGNFKEIYIAILHYSPLLMLMLNMILFM